MTDADLGKSVLNMTTKAPEQPGCGEMVERVKKAVEIEWAIADMAPRGVTNEMKNERMARAAIAAMREPTGKMIDAGVNMTKIEQALSEIKRRAVRTDLNVWRADDYVKCICITEDALREALKEVFGKASVLDPEPRQHTPQL